jgi:Calcineurin-like phosphoesterase
MKTLATFVHFSDLHIGRSDQVGDAEIPSVGAGLPWFDGLLGHSYNALRKLAWFWEDLSRMGSAHTVFTGDLTSAGRAAEFTAGSDFLSSEWTPPNGNFVGLRCGSLWRDRAVPGNHDHWPGSGSVLGHPRPELWTTFRVCPYFTAPVALQTGHKLRFAGIDTDRDVGPRSYRRMLARGAFTRDLKKLDGELPLPEPAEIRVLLLHHSPGWDGLALGMNSASKKALLEFCTKWGFSVLLCGHTHRPELRVMSLVHVNLQRCTVLQACCGSSSIRTTLPMDSSFLGRRLDRPSWLPNSLLVHTLIASAKALIWRVQAYYETSRSFQVINGLPSEMDSASIEFPAGSGVARQPRAAAAPEPGSVHAGGTN